MLGLGSWFTNSVTSFLSLPTDATQATDTLLLETEEVHESISLLNQKVGDNAFKKYKSFISSLNTCLDLFHHKKSAALPTCVSSHMFHLKVNRAEAGAAEVQMGSGTCCVKPLLIYQYGPSAMHGRGRILLTWQVREKKIITSSSSLLVLYLLPFCCSL